MIQPNNDLKVKNTDGFSVSECYQNIKAGYTLAAYNMLLNKARASPYKMGARCAALVNYCYDSGGGESIKDVLAVINEATRSLKVTQQEQYLRRSNAS